MSGTIDTGDAVLHIPSGETWLVAYCDNGYVCCCGWPCSLAKVEDCQLKRKATPEKRMELLHKLAAMSGYEALHDPRRLYALRTLEKENGDERVGN